MPPTPPCSAPARWWQMRTSGLLLCWELQLGTYSVGFFFSSQLCCPLRFQNSPQTRRWECFLVFGNISSFKTPSPGWSPSLTLLSLFLSFIFCPTSFWREWTAFLGAQVSFASVQKLFCGSCLAFKWSFDLLNLWGRKWSPCPIPLPSSDRLSNTHYF